MSKKEDPNIIVFLFYKLQSQKLISYGDRGIKALPPESEGP